MKSRVHLKYKTKYRVGNWPEYDRALVQRGDIMLWISADAIDAWTPAPSGKRGGQMKFSEIAIETALTLGLVFGLPLRQAEGFLRSVLLLMRLDLQTPDHTTLSRRSQRLDIGLHLAKTSGPVRLIVDSTGLSIVGEGEWAAAKHGGTGKRGWKKLYLGVDGSDVIVAQALTDGNVDDAKTGLALIEAVEGDIASVTADAAYDTIAIYEAGNDRGAKVVVPPTKTAMVSRGGRRSAARDRTIRQRADFWQPRVKRRHACTGLRATREWCSNGTRNRRSGGSEARKPVRMTWPHRPDSHIDSGTGLGAGHSHLEDNPTSRVDRALSSRSSGIVASS